MFCTCWSVSRTFCRPRDVCSMSLDPCAWKLPISVQWMSLKSRFEVTWSKVKVKLLVFEKSLSTQYILTPLLENRQTQYIVDGPWEWIDVPYWCSGHMVKIQGQTPKFCLLTIIRVKLWIKGKLSTANHRNVSSQKIVAYFAIKPSR